ncbi:hypothetical protein M2232_007393 [Bradyrhizobium japonicum]|nr:hypothetical protein [Bradyrhizobium japonicum]MCW2348473.1 hypothetical protein [Bradyrhizobium japonicum]
MFQRISQAAESSPIEQAPLGVTRLGICKSSARGGAAQPSFGNPSVQCRNTIAAARLTALYFRQLQILVVDPRGVLRAESRSTPQESKAMSPLEAITRWLDSQDLGMQLEIAGFATFLVFGDDDTFTLGDSEQLESLYRWLNEPSLASGIAAERALTFRVYFASLAEDRSTGAGWKRTEVLVRRILKDATRDGRFAAARKAQRMLELLPARKESWNQVVRSWNEFAATYLTHEALSSWSAAEKLRGLRAISSTSVPVAGLGSPHRGAA